WMSISLRAESASGTGAPGTGSISGESSGSSVFSVPSIVSSCGERFGLGGGRGEGDRADQAPQLGQAGALLGADRDDACRGLAEAGLERLDPRARLVLGERVDLVGGERPLELVAVQELAQLLVALARLVARVDDEDREAQRLAVHQIG